MSRVQAQESVIDGLREERQLWGRELAHQGATLAQDRGRMEAQLQGLSEEVKSTREQLQREREAVRIKEKQVHHKMITEWLLVNYQHRVVFLLASNLHCYFPKSMYL